MGSLLALFSSVLWGTADYLAGNLSKRYKAIAVTGVSQFFGLIFGVSTILLFSEFIEPNLSWNGYFLPGVVAGIAGFIGLISFYTGLATGRMGVVSPISSLSVVIPLAFALAKGERPSILQTVGIIIAIAGAFMASGPEIKNGLPIKPILFAVVAAIGFGTALTFIAIGSETDSLHTMTAMRVASVTVCVFLAIKFKTIGGFVKSNIPLLIFIGVADFLANFLLGVATTKGLVSIAMVFGSLFPIVTILLAFKFLHERLMKVQYVGIAFALGGVILIAAS
ncbi:MAG: DMT family transporter [Candidatus Nanopelagicaceae bacterium]|nr:DMT family transporter [Candidatus Nanopelagicaceae bacterium]